MPSDASRWNFGPFTLDSSTACLWHGTDAVPLSPKAFDVLHYLVTHPDRLVTKDELLDAVWPETAVSDAVVRVAIGALRKALQDTVPPPRFIATLPRRGYRFLAPVTRTDAAGARVDAPTSFVAPLPPPWLVEREAVLQHLGDAWSQARQGQRRVIFVTGEAGMGKTSVVEALTAQVRLDPTVWLAYGQCVEHYGAGEPYLPVLEALGQLCHAPGGARLGALLRQQAPTWLVQMPWLLTETDRQQWRYELQGTTRERMLREFAEVVETLTAETPLVLVLEDLHWSDYATLDVLALLARRQTPARLLVLGTYRPVEAIVQEHPLRTLVQELRQHRHSTEVPLALLSPAAVAAYLAARFPGHGFSAALAPRLHAHTEGNPLFLVTLLQSLVERGVLAARDDGWAMQGGLDAVEVGIPETLRQLIEHQLAYVPPETQRVLEMASVAGVAFATAAVAAGLGDDVTAVEAHCEELARRHLIRSVGLVTWPDGTVVTRYEFTHALYQQVAYARLGPGHRGQLHQRLGTRLETAYGPRAAEIAAELAEHFERGHDIRRAVHYLHQAAENAARRSAHREVIDLLTRALALLRQLPEASERLQQELDIQVALVPAWMAIKGYAAPEVEQACARAHEICQQVGNTSQLFLALQGMWRYACVQGALQTAQELAGQLLQLAQSAHDSDHLLVAHWALSRTYAYRGELVRAREHAQQGQALYHPQQHYTLALRYGTDPGVVCLSLDATVLWLLGMPDQALARMHDALTLAHELAHPPSQAYILFFVIIVHQLRREPQVAGEQAEALVALCMTHGFALYLATGMIFRGMALVAQGQPEEAIVQIRQGLAALQTTGAVDVWRPYFLTLLVEASMQAGQLDEGMRLLAEAQALLETTGERWWEAEVHRLHGGLLWRHARTEVSQVETCFLQALAVARRQQARSLELRAAMSLARLWQQQGRRADAHQLLTEVYGWFTEGFETADVQEARALLEQLR